MWFCRTHQQEISRVHYFFSDVVKIGVSSEYDGDWQGSRQIFKHDLIESY